jgi:hypothetical protein
MGKVLKWLVAGPSVKVTARFEKETWSPPAMQIQRAEGVWN